MNTTERYYAAPSQVHDRSYSVFERGRLNHHGEPYCYAPGLTEREARRLVRELNDRERRIGAKVRATTGPSYEELYPDE